MSVYRGLGLHPFFNNFALLCFALLYVSFSTLAVTRVLNVAYAFQSDVRFTKQYTKWSYLDPSSSTNIDSSSSCWIYTEYTLRLRIAFVNDTQNDRSFCIMLNICTRWFLHSSLACIPFRHWWIFAPMAYLFCATMMTPKSYGRRRKTEEKK